ncbi:MAG: type II secretion system F family protein, partial [Burkholderiales bacterium]
MAGFEYLALDAAGRTVKGVLEGDAERQVRALLRDRGLTPLQIEAIHADTPGLSKVRALRRRLSAADLALLMRQFATLARAGLPVEACLNVLIEQTESTRVRAVLAGVRGRVLEGQSLSRSLAAFPEAFPEMHLAMVEAGEQSGRLEEVLDRLADYSENRETLRQKVLLAFIYPALVTIVAIGVISLLLVYVVPQVTRVFANNGQTLPWVTRALIALSEFVRAGAWVWATGLIAAVAGARLALRNQAMRLRWH